MISIVLAASALKQSDIDKVLPAILGQKDIPGGFEVILVAGFDLNLVNHPNLTIVRQPYPFDLVTWMNKGFSVAKGDVILIIQADMLINSKHTVRNMLGLLKHGWMVSERYFKKGQRSLGAWANMLMLYKQDLANAGYFYPGYAGLVSFEDSDLMATLLGHGLHLKRYSQDEPYATLHLDHPTNYTDPIALDKINKAKAIYFSRHKYDYTRMFLLEYMWQVHNNVKQ